LNNDDGDDETALVRDLMLRDFAFVMVVMMMAINIYRSILIVTKGRRKSSKTCMVAMIGLLIGPLLMMGKLDIKTTSGSRPCFAPMIRR